jgi:hypothetical protein
VSFDGNEHDVENHIQGGKVPPTLATHGRKTRNRSTYSARHRLRFCRSLSVGSFVLQASASQSHAPPRWRRVIITRPQESPSYYASSRSRAALLGPSGSEVTRFERVRLAQDTGYRRA